MAPAMVKFVEADEVAAMVKPADSTAGSTPATPQGLTEAQLVGAANLIYSETSYIGGEVLVQGSRAAGTATTTSDIDFAIRVSPDQFNALVEASFGSPNPGSAKFRTMQHAIVTGKIQAGEAGLRSTRRRLEAMLGIEVDLTVIRHSGPFDNPPYIPVPKPR
jgi:predicted nucleotidyltransferase